MIRKITLDNFMSHRHTEIELASGLTVLAGENNCGKSAVVAALQILCNNTSGDYMVRHGSKECRVAVETEEGHVIEWKRDGGTVSYTLNGQMVHRLRGGIPEDLHKLLRIPQVYPQDGNDPFDIHFAEQKKPIFLLDESGGRAAKFFASSSDAEALIRMQIRHRDNIREASQRSARAQLGLKQIDERLRFLEPVTSIQCRLTELDILYADLETLRNRAKRLESDMRFLEQTSYEVGLYEQSVSVSSRLVVPPHMRDTNSLTELVENLGRWSETFGRSVLQDRALHCLYSPPKLTPTMEAEALVSSTAQASRRVHYVSEIILTLSNLSAAPKPALVGQLDETCAEIERCLFQVLYKTEVTACNNALQLPPKLFDIASILDHIAKIRAATISVLGSQEKTSVLGICPVPPRLRDELTLGDLLRRMEKSSSEIRRRLFVSEAMRGLHLPPREIDLSELEALIAQGQNALNNVDTRYQQLDLATRRAKEGESAVRDWVNINRLCPTCGAELDADRLIAMTNPTGGGHVHG